MIEYDSAPRAGGRPKRSTSSPLLVAPTRLSAWIVSRGRQIRHRLAKAGFPRGRLHSATGAFGMRHHVFERALNRSPAREPTTLKALAKNAYVQVRRPRLLLAVCLAGIASSVVYPSDLSSYRDTPRSEHVLVTGTERYGRHINTIAVVALPIVKRDPIGVLQIVYLGVTGAIMTHGLKRALDPVVILGVRLGERPYGGRHNMPSGHASLASSAVYFVGRRYGWWHLFYLLPVLLLTMLARVALDAHTGSAVIAGALIGIFCAALFTGKHRS
ncbi:lipid A 1-phosphatase LpxE [Luteimonas sp. SJ-92]|uniref:Lipid A 1-phosphatase LpxE n=1 Tax=Luteimonas salinisoli TaxID=2752307 RepID=A0A853J9X9_9GAMM|nr:lipid A 1-phosphatase LpxE [Luteimonas salinisoli]